MAVPLLPLLTMLPGVIQGVSSLFDRGRRKREEQKASRGISNLADVYKTSLEGNYMDTPEVQRILAELQKQQGQNTRAINATGATTGMTDEAKIATMGRQNEATAGTVGNIASGGDLWRQRTQQLYGQGLNNLFNVGQANRQNFNNNIASITQPLNESIGAGINAGAFDGMEIFKKKTKAVA